MASKYLQKFPVPNGFQEILSDFTRQVLRDQPNNIIEYAALYFQSLQNGKKFEYDSKFNVKKEDKKYELAYNAKNAEDIRKKAGKITQNLNKNASASGQNTSVNTKANANVDMQTETITPGITPINEQKLQESRASSNKGSDRKYESKNAADQIQKSQKVSARSKQQVDISQNPPGTEKTVTGEETANYVDNLSKTITDQQGQGFSQAATKQEIPVSEAEAEQSPQQPKKQSALNQSVSRSNAEEDSMINQATYETVDALFSNYDLDKNGYLSSTEINRFITEVINQVDKSFSLKPQDIQEIINEVDRDKDGKISKQQLAAFILKMFKNDDSRSEISKSEMSNSINN